MFELKAYVERRGSSHACPILPCPQPVEDEPLLPPLEERRKHVDTELKEKLIKKYVDWCDKRNKQWEPKPKEEVHGHGHGHVKQEHPPDDSEYWQHEEGAQSA